MENPQLERTLSLFSLVMMGMGMMIGAGVFVASGISISKGGAGSLIIAFTLNGLIALFTAMSYAELSSAISKAGGPYNWASFGLGKFPGFLTGWMEWLAAIVAGSLYAITFAAYTVKFFNESFSLGISGWELELIVKAFAVAIALVFIYINYRGASETGAAAVIMAAGQMITLAVICVAALFLVVKEPSHFDNFKNFIPEGWGKILVAMGLTYVAFEGFEVICQTGDEAIDPKRNIPKALFYSLIAVVSIYVLLSISMVIGVEGSSPIEFFRQGGDPSVRFSDSIKNVIPYGGLIVTIAVIFSATSALNSTIYSATRISYALGRDKFLPGLFSSILQKTRIPGFALLATSVILLIIAVAIPIEHVAAAASVLFLFVFMIANIAVIKIRKDFSDKLKYGYVMPFFPFLTIIAICFQFVMIFKLLEESSWTVPIVFGWIALGGVVFFFYSRKRAVVQQPEVKILESTHVVFKTNYSILVPVGNPQNIKGILSKAIKICEKNSGEIILYNFIYIPDQSPMEIANNYVDERRKLLNEAKKLIPEHVVVNSVMKYGRDFSKSILNTVNDYNIKLIIMGWKGHSSHYFFSLGRSLDPVVENTTCNIMIVKTGNNEKTEYSSIIIPSGGASPQQTMFSIDAAISMIKNDGEITLWTMKRKDQSTNSAKVLLLPFVKYAKKSNIDVKLKIVEESSVVESLIKESEKYDLMILGASRSGLLVKTAFGNIPEKVASEAKSSVVMVKTPIGIKSFINRWFGG